MSTGVIDSLLTAMLKFSNLFRVLYGLNFAVADREGGHKLTKLKL